jgi:hypothetical protein
MIVRGVGLTLGGVRAVARAASDRGGSDVGTIARIVNHGCTQMDTDQTGDNALSQCIIGCAFWVL